ncbi:MAG: 2-phosphosulfolactate phosphatase [Pedosphaera sp.]|nr:2-phosphosulfolactate phosphatase [Pedosphaera sp.]
MTCRVEVLFTPTEFRALRERDLARTTCVVFDVLRATSTIVTALAAGAASVLPVNEIAEALAVRRQRPDVLLAGERDGLRIGAALTGGIEFDLGNSPREFTAARVAGKTIVMTTTNGTRALRACAGAERILVASFLNLEATADFLGRENPESLLLVCAGTGKDAALEDTLAAGALCDALKSAKLEHELEDAALIARDAFLQARQDLAHAIGEARNARRLLRQPELRDDVEFCLRRNAFPLVAANEADGGIRRLR